MKDLYDLQKQFIKDLYTAKKESEIIKGIKEIYQDLSNDNKEIVADLMNDYNIEQLEHFLINYYRDYKEREL